MKSGLECSVLTNPKKAVNQTNDVENFLGRLEVAKSRDLNPNFQKLITAEDLKSICDYFLSNERLQASLFNVLISLKPGTGYAFPKETTLLPRTVNILCSMSGEYQLIVETKAKSNVNEKLSLPSISGTHKVGKTAWRVDKEEEIMNLVISSVHENIVESKIEMEAYFAQKVGKKFVTKTIAGPTYQSKKLSDSGETLYKKSIYVPKAICLFDLLIMSILSQKDKNEIILALLKSVKKIHDNHFVHQDIKLENTLVIKKNNRWLVSLCDFGDTVEEGDFVCPKASSIYQSPEVASTYFNTNALMHDYYFSQEGLQSLGNSIFCERVSKEGREYLLSFLTKQSPDPANDMWALGIVIFAIQYEKLPTIQDLDFIQNHPLLGGLLAESREKRMNINAALQCFNDMLAQVNERKNMTSTIERSDSINRISTKFNRLSI